MSMSTKHQNLLTNKRIYILQNLICNDDFEVFFTVLLQNDIFTESMVQQVKCEKTDSSRASKCLDLVARRGPDAFKTFIRALIISRQEPVAMNIDAKMTKEVKQELSREPKLNTSEISSSEEGAKMSLAETTAGSNEVEKNKEEQCICGPSEIQPCQSPQYTVRDSEYLNQACDDEMDCGKISTSASLSSEWENYLKICEKGGPQFMTAEIANVKTIKEVSCGRFVLIADNDSDSFVVNLNLKDFFAALGFKEYVPYDSNAQPISEIIEKEKEILNNSIETLDGFAMIVMWRGLDGQTDGSRYKFISDILKFFNEHPRLSNTLKFCCCQLMSNPVKNEDIVDQANIGTHNLELTTTLGANEVAALYVETISYEEFPNVFPWAIIKVFSSATVNESLQDLLNKVQEFVVKHAKSARS